MEEKKSTRSRRKRVSAPVLASDMSGLSSNYCRKCQRMLAESKFYQATDPNLDSNGKMSVCKSCCGALYDNFYSHEGSIEKAVYKVCKALNVVYSEDSVSKLRSHMDTSLASGRNIKSPFGIYMSKVMSRIEGSTVTDLTFNDYSRKPEVKLSDEELEEYEGIVDLDEIDSLKRKWGSNYEVDDLVFLEDQLEEWKATHKHDTKAEKTLLEDLCHLELRIKKAREEEMSTTALVKEKQDLMKTASVDPAKANAASSGRNKELFSEYIREIEENEPAEFFENRKKFKDWDNIGWYMYNYFIRALKNFVTQSRDFNITEKEDSATDIFEGTISDYAIDAEG